MGTTREYPTATPGLVVIGSSKRRRWSVMHEQSRQLIAPMQLGNMVQGFVTCNLFETRRDALAAAERVGQRCAIDWTQGAETLMRRTLEAHHGRYPRQDIIRAIWGTETTTDGR